MCFNGVEVILYFSCTWPSNQLTNYRIFICQPFTVLFARFVRREIKASVRLSLINRESDFCSHASYPSFHNWIYGTMKPAFYNSTTSEGFFRKGASDIILYFYLAHYFIHDSRCGILLHENENVKLPRDHRGPGTIPLKRALLYNKRKQNYLAVYLLIKKGDL